MYVFLGLRFFWCLVFPEHGNGQRKEKVNTLAGGQPLFQTALTSNNQANPCSHKRVKWKKVVENAVYDKYCISQTRS